MNKRFRNVSINNIVLFLSKYFYSVIITKQISNLNNTNLSYKIKLNEKYYVLKIYYKNNEKKILQDLSIQKQFYKCGFPCPNAISLNKKSLFRESNFNFSIFEYIEGSHINEVSKEDIIDSISVLSQLYSISHNWKSKVSIKKDRIPPVEVGKYKTIFEILLKKYRLLDRIKPKNKILIHGDFNFSQILKNQDGKIILIDFESVKYGDQLEDLANLIFFSHCGYAKYNKKLPLDDILNHIKKKYSLIELNIEGLRIYIQKSSIKYALGSIWEYNHQYINETELKKRLKVSNSIDLLI